MKLTINTPKPVVTPPPSFTIDLSLEEALILRSILSRRSQQGLKPLEPLRLALWGATKNMESPVHIAQCNGIGAYIIQKK